MAFASSVGTVSIPIDPLQAEQGPTVNASSRATGIPKLAVNSSEPSASKPGVMDLGVNPLCSNFLVAKS